MFLPSLLILLSVNQFAKGNNCVFLFGASEFSIQDCVLGKILFRGPSSNGLYPFAGSISCNVFSPKAFVEAIVPMDVWHKRLGHSFPSVVQMILTTSALLKDSTSSFSFCEYCKYGKSCKLPFTISKIVTKQPLELIHSDVWGPAPTSSICGFQYYVLFIDDFLNTLRYFL